MLPDQQANAGKMEGKKQKKSSPPNLIQAKSNLDKLQNETEQIISQAVYSDEDGSVVEESIVKLQKFNSEPVKAKSSSTLLNSKSKAAAPKPQQQKKMHHHQEILAKNLKETRTRRMRHLTIQILTFQKLKKFYRRKEINGKINRL